MTQIDTRLSGPDFLQAVADAELANGNEINAAEFRRRAREWQQDQDAITTPKPRMRAEAINAAIAAQAGAE